MKSHFLLLVFPERLEKKLLFLENEGHRKTKSNKPPAQVLCCILQIVIPIRTRLYFCFIFLIPKMMSTRMRITHQSLRTPSAAPSINLVTKGKAKAKRSPIPRTVPITRSLRSFMRSYFEGPNGSRMFAPPPLSLPTTMGVLPSHFSTIWS